jgi:hypothetical protein
VSDGALSPGGGWRRFFMFLLVAVHCFVPGTDLFRTVS